MELFQNTEQKFVIFQKISHGLFFAPWLMEIIIYAFIAQRIFVDLARPF